MRKNNYTKEFKEKIVQEIISGKKTQAQVCREYKIASGTLSPWVTKYKNGESLTSRGAIRNKEKELNRKISQLEQLIGQQTIEIALLKKAKALSEQKLKDELSGKPMVGLSE